MLTHGFDLRQYSWRNLALEIYISLFLVLCVLNCDRIIMGATLSQFYLHSRFNQYLPDRLNPLLQQNGKQTEEKNIWQRRFWEHFIRDERDYVQHCDYLHYNPVKHGLCLTPTDWPFSSIHRFIAQGIYPPDWGLTSIPEKPIVFWDD